jgi:hypothetical protein
MISLTTAANRGEYWASDLGPSSLYTVTILTELSWPMPEANRQLFCTKTNQFTLFIHFNFNL